MTNFDEKTAAAALNDAVDGAYLAFRRHRARPSTLDICGFCCVSESTARRLLQEPLAQLNSSDFCEYNDSGKRRGRILPRLATSFLACSR